MNKLYYGKDYSPDSNDPPLCFSANGVAPSRDAMSPQSATCMQCPHNVRGSAVSKLTGAPIKACRDEKWLAVLVPGIDIGWQFRLTPGSFSNYRAYAEKFKGQNFDIADVMTRLQFEKDAMGVITFQPASFIDADMAARRNKAIEAKVTDVLVGRTDQPIAALPAPQAQPAAIAAPAAQPAPFGNTAPTAPGAEAPAKRRGRKPASETAAPANGPAPVGAPFRPEPAPPFGVAASAPPPPADIKAQMDSFFNS